MGEPILVVDFGAWRTSAAVLVDGRSSLVAEPTTGSYRWPSTALLEGESLLIGDSARHRRDELARCYVDGIRPAVDSGSPVRLGERQFSGEELLAAYLTGIRGEAQRQLGTGQLGTGQLGTGQLGTGGPGTGQIGRLVLVIPAGYASQEARTQRMLAVASAAGYPDVELVSDAVAASLDPLLEADTGPRPEGALVLVCDLGLAWSVTLCQVRNGQPVPIGHEDSAAGNDLDALLVRDFRAVRPDLLEPALAAGGERAALANFEAADLVRRLKHRLVDREDVQERVGANGEPYRLSRDDVQRCAEPALRWLVASARAVVARAGRGLHEVSEVLLVGGAARIPSARTMLEHGLRLQVTLPPDPDLAVVRGAAHWAGQVADRAVASELPLWRVEPLSWQLPGDPGRLLRWLVEEGQPYPAAATLAQVRTATGRVFDLTARHEGILLEQRIPVGALLDATTVAATARSAAVVAGDRPIKRHEFQVAGEWLLTPDRNFLVECPADGGYVKVRSIITGAVVGELRPEPAPARHGRVFISPAGSLTLVCWQENGQFRVWDVGTGQQLVAFREAARPLTVLVNEARWRLVAEVDKQVQVGRYRREVVNVWDLSTGVRVDEQVDDRYAGYGDRSPSDGFATAMSSPDGRLRAATTTGPGGASVALLDPGTEREIFRTGEPGAQWVRAAFSGDGQHLLASWKSAERSWVEVWRI